ncbi:MAG: MerR family transcriptional regulator [Paracoccus sp. (in: a-proteobacteria)]|uniref:MerR family transcriptional regulator n=1 Tax=Paracoccus sp. TaxID=267 RepID=UPI0039E4B1C3
MVKSPDAFRSIGEVSRMVGVAPHVLRYWETQFSQLSPVKRGDGRRYYRPEDVRLAAGLCQILREEGLSIRGAKRMLASDRGERLRRLGAVRLGEAVARTKPAPAAAPAQIETPPPRAFAPYESQAPQSPVCESSLPGPKAESRPDPGAAPAAPLWLARLAATGARLRARNDLPPHLQTALTPLRSALAAGPRS